MNERAAAEVDAIQLPGEKIANEWIREGIQRWLRKATRLGMNREAGRHGGPTT